MIDALIDLLEQIVYAAIVEHDFHYVTHSGEPARYTLYRPCGCGIGHGESTSLILAEGGTMLIHRTARLLVEPLGSVTLRPVHVVIERWVTT